MASRNLQEQITNHYILDMNRVDILVQLFLGNPQITPHE